MALSTNRSLQYLDISDNGLGDDGASKLLAPALRKNRSLLALLFDRNGIALPGFKAVSKALIRNKALISVDSYFHDADTYTQWCKSESRRLGNEVSAARQRCGMYHRSGNFHMKARAIDEIRAAKRGISHLSRATSQLGAALLSISQSITRNASPNVMAATHKSGRKTKLPSSSKRESVATRSAKLILKGIKGLVKAIYKVAYAKGPPVSVALQQPQPTLLRGPATVTLPLPSFASADTHAQNEAVASLPLFQLQPPTPPSYLSLISSHLIACGTSIIEPSQMMGLELLINRAGWAQETASALSFLHHIWKMIVIRSKEFALNQESFFEMCCRALGDFQMANLIADVEDAERKKAAQRCQRGRPPRDPRFHSEGRARNMGRRSYVAHLNDYSDSRNAPVYYGDGDSLGRQHSFGGGPGDIDDAVSVISAGGDGDAVDMYGDGGGGMNCMASLVYNRPLREELLNELSEIELLVPPSTMSAVTALRTAEQRCEDVVRENAILLQELAHTPSLSPICSSPEKALFLINYATFPRAFCTFNCINFNTATSNAADILASSSQNSFRPHIDHGICLITQCSVDRLHNLEQQIMRWGDGYVSCAVYISTADINVTQDSLRACADFIRRVGRNAKAKVLLSLLFGVENRPELWDAFVDLPLYPINALRNLALFAAPSQVSLVFLVDVDFVPSLDLYGYLNEHKTSMLTRCLQDRLAWVVPAFEYNTDRHNEHIDKCAKVGDVDGGGGGGGIRQIPFVGHTDSLPSTQSALSEAVRNGRASGFHMAHFPQGHGATDFDRWFREITPYNISYQDHYEPYVVMHRQHVPAYDERFRGYGMNKVAHLFHCHSLGVQFAVIPFHFVCAREHAKSRDWLATYCRRKKSARLRLQALKHLFLSFKRSVREACGDARIMENVWECVPGRKEWPDHKYQINVLQLSVQHVSACTAAMLKATESKVATLESVRLLLGSRNPRSAKTTRNSNDDEGDRLKEEKETMS